MNDIKCERCKKQFISEEFENHLCQPILTEVQEIGIDSMFKAPFQENGDNIWIAQGLNGISYRLVQCPHNPPHPNSDPTTFSNENNRRGLHRTIKDHIFQ